MMRLIVCLSQREIWGQNVSPFIHRIFPQHYIYNIIHNICTALFTTKLHIIFMTDIINRRIAWRNSAETWRTVSRSVTLNKVVPHSGNYQSQTLLILDLEMNEDWCSSASVTLHRTVQRDFTYACSGSSLETICALMYSQQQDTKV